MSRIFPQLKNMLHTDRIFALLFLLFLWVPLLFNYFAFEKFEILKFGIWFFILGLIFFSLPKEKKISINPAVGIIIVLAVVGLLVSVYFSENLLTSLFGNYPRLNNSLLFWLVFVSTFLLLTKVTDFQKITVFGQLLFFDAILIGVVAILQSYGVGFYQGPEATNVFARAPSLLGNPNFSSMFMAAVLPFSLALFFNKSSFYGKVYYALGAFVVLAGICVLSSRGAWVALIVSLLIQFFLLAIFRFKGKILLASIFLIVVSGASIGAVSELARPQSLEQTLNLTEQNVNLRFYVWDMALSAISQKPIYGVGPGNFHLFFERNRGQGLAFEDGVFDDAHNLFLQLGATVGIIFLIGFLALIVFALASGYGFLKKTLRDQSGETGLANALFVLSAISALLAWVLAAAFNPVSSANFLLLAFLLGFLCSVSGLVSFKLNIPIGVRPILWLLGLIFVCCGISYIAGDMLFRKGYESFKRQDFLASYSMLVWAEKVLPINSSANVYRIGSEIMLGRDSVYVQDEITAMTQKKPTDSKSFYSSASLYFLLFDKTNNSSFGKQAVVEMTKSLSIDQYHALRWTRTAFYKASLGDLKEARELAKVGVSLSDYSLPAMALLAKIYQLEGENKKGQAIMLDAFKRHPDSEITRTIARQIRSGVSFGKVNIPSVVDVFQLD